MKLLLLILSVLFVNGIVLNAQNPINFNYYDYKNNQEKIIKEIVEAANRFQVGNSANSSMFKNETPSVNLNQNERIVSDNPASESEIAIALNPNDSNNIVVSPILQDGLNRIRPVTCPVYYSTDFGETWAKSSFAPSPILGNSNNNLNYQIIGGGDPMFAFDNNGRLYFSWISLYLTLNGITPDSIFAKMFYAFSDNGGKDWVYNKNCTILKSGKEANGKYNGMATMFNGKMLDKQWMAADLSVSSPYKGTVYLASLGMDMSDGQLVDAAMYLWKKLPGRDYFEKTPIRITKERKEMQGVSLSVDARGWVHISCLYSSSQNAEYHHFVSKDGGNTFVQTGKITNFYGTMPRQPFFHSNNNNTGLNRLYPQNNMASDIVLRSIYRNNLYFTWTANGFTNDLGKGFDAYFSRSTDNGTTWDTPIKINQDNTNRQNYYPFITVNPNGVVCAAWYDRRDDENDSKSDYYIAYSFDGGKTFSDNIKVTSQPTNFANFIGARRFGIGEYNTLVATKGMCIPVWADDRDGDGMLDVYIGKVPISQHTTGLNEVINISGSLKLNISPNPATEFAKADVYSKLNTIANISILDIRGKTILTMKNISLLAGDNSIDLDLGSLGAGVYFAEIVTENSFTIKKFVVK